MTPSDAAALSEAVGSAFAALGLGTAIALGLAGIALAAELLARRPRPRRRDHKRPRPSRRGAREVHP